MTVQGNTTPSETGIGNARSGTCKHHAHMQGGHSWRFFRVIEISVPNWRHKEIGLCNLYVMQFFF